MTNALSDPLIGYLLDDRYEVVERIARGGMAAVYRAVDHRLDRDVALKVMHAHLAEGSEFVARFRREARAAARLVHPGIVAVYDQGTAGDAPYLVMELVDGPNLRQVLTDRKALPIGEALDITEQVLDALAAAHREGFVHRDIKPENVLIAADRAKLADFGLARTISEVTAATTGTVLGTVAYLSPELVSDGQADTRSDVYAVGIMCYEMIMGRQPYTGDSAIAVAFQHINSTVPRPSDTYSWIPVEVDEVITSLTARDLTERPPDAAAALEMVRHVRRGLDEQTLQSAVPIARPPSASTPRHPPVGMEGGSTTHVPLTSPRKTAALDAGTPPTLPPLPNSMRPVSTGGNPGHGGPVALPPDPPHVGKAPRPRRRGLIIALSCVLAVILGTGGYIGWYMFKGPGSLVEVPSVVGWTKEQVDSAFDKAGLKPAYTEENSDGVDEGDVISTNPVGGSKVEAGATVDVVISAGVLMVPTPNVIGKLMTEAQATIETAGLSVGQITEEFSTDVPEDHVIEQSPMAGEGETQPHYQLINLKVSKGPEPITMPKFLAMSEAEAQNACRTNELKCNFADQQFSDVYKSGTVMDQSVPEGTDAHKGDEVTLTLSKGQDLVQVPSVTRLSEQEAIDALKKAGLEADIKRTPADPPLNFVLEQSPKAYQWVPRGSAVSITVA